MDGEWVLFMRVSQAMYYVRIVIFFDTPDHAVDFAFNCLCWEYAVFPRDDLGSVNQIHVEEMRWLDADLAGEDYICPN